MSEQVTSRKPFGLATNARPMKNGDIVLRWQNGEGPYKRENITVGIEMIDQWKVITSYVGYDHAGNPGLDGKRRVFSKIDILPPGTICTETYLVIGSYDTEEEARNLVHYMKTRFFRFLVSQFMYSHHITKEAYLFVPLLDMSIEWTDDALYKRYGLTKEEIAFIESKIRPMDNGVSSDE
jgi:site-specific DNA-methyltransferase (adenine-specific)